MRRREFLSGLVALALAPIDLKAAREWLAGVETPEGRWDALDGVRVRVIPGQRGSVLHLHGGGWCAGSALSGEPDLVQLSRDTGLTVVSVEYRLAPEHPYPAGPEDCEHAARAFLREYPAPRFLRGVSAGAHLAATTLLRVPGFDGAVLYYGCYDLEGTPSRLQAKDADHPDLAPSHMAQFVRWFMPDGGLRSASPLHAELPELPPALMLVGERDILVDDTRLMAQRWPACEAVVYPGVGHGFDGEPGPESEDAKRRERAFLTSR